MCQITRYKQTVVGEYNKEIAANDTETPYSATALFIVGNGQSGEKSNALEVWKNGDIKIAINGTDATEILQEYLVPTGTINSYAGAGTPAGWLLCQGQAVSRTTYARLFKVIGTTYGSGNGSTTFNVPDTRNRTVVGVGNKYSLGGIGGVDSVSLSGDNNGPHDHIPPDGGRYVSYKPDIGLGVGVAGGSNIGLNWTSGTSGSGTAHENRQPYIAMNCIIKT